MTVGVPRETYPGERRVAATPDSTARLTALGFEVRLERGAGLAAGFDDNAYEAAGAVIGRRDDVWSSAIVATIRAPQDADIERLGPGQTLISFLYPAQNSDLVQRLRLRGISAIAMDQVPRTTRAQKVDALSSMGNLAGYRAVVEAAHALQRPLAGQTTAAGRIPPCTVLIIGAGVAGLAAIGAARSLGAIVRAFDTRAAAREQVASMGAEFLEVDIEEEGSGTGGYAREMSPAFIAAEMALFAAQAREVDVIITTALIPGKKAPTLITADMVASMRRGSVIVDLAAEMGGNCERTRPGEAVDVDGVTVIGYTDLPSRLARQASMLYATNVANLLEEMGGAAAFRIDEANDIVRPMTVIKDGAVLWPPPPPPPPSPPPAASARQALKESPSQPALAKSPSQPDAASPKPPNAAEPAPPKPPNAAGPASPKPPNAAGPASPKPPNAAEPAPPKPPNAAEPAPPKPPKAAKAGPPVRPPSAKSWLLLGAAGLALFGIGAVAPPTFLTHLTVFVLACVIGYHVIWNVTPALHTPLMSVTNAISGIIVLGGMLQVSGGIDSTAELLGLAAIFVAAINVSGGFLVTQRMLKMFHK